MPTVGHFGKVFFVSYSYIIVNDFGTHNAFLMLLSSLGLIFMLTYVPNPIWRPSAILEKSSFILTPFSHVIPLMLLILVCRIHFWYYFRRWRSPLASKIRTKGLLVMETESSEFIQVTYWNCQPA